MLTTVIDLATTQFVGGAVDVAWINVTDDRGRCWRLSQIGLWLLVRQNIYNRAIRRHSQRMHETHWIGPDRFWGDTDFTASAAECDRDSYPIYARLEREAMRDGARGATDAVAASARQ